MGDRSRLTGKSGAPSDVISLPKGGGALQGLGEKFSPDLHTGTGNFTIPIALPPGRNGFQPQLSLVYSTGNGNGPFGLGWSLTIPGVSRKTSRGVPRYNDTKDIFILSGAEDLVPVDGAPQGVVRYRPRTEGLFALIDHSHGGQDDYWEVKSKDGLVSYYGTPGTAGDDPAVIADPNDRGKISAWKLSLTLDPFGNRIEYEYERDLGRDGPHHWDQIYLKQIRYVDYTEDGETKFLVSVEFKYENRPDAYSVYRGGFEVRTRRRCKSIEIRTQADQDRLVRSYLLTYLDEATVDRDLLPKNDASLLKEFRVIGHEGSLSEELPPLRFGYTRFEPKKRDFFPLEGEDLPAISLGDPNLELVDLFGAGLPDILEMNGTVRYWRNLGGGRFDLPREMKTAPSGLRLTEVGVQFADANGDGRLDLMVTTDRLSGYYPLRFGGQWDRRSFQKYQAAPSFNLEDPEVRLMDLDGDGVTDALRSGSRLECYFNHPTEGWKETRWVPRRAVDEFPNVSFSDPRVRLSDMSGDGLQDVVLIHDGNTEYWPSLGHGDWGPRVSMRNSPRFPERYDPSRILLGDVDGDGLSDLVYVDSRRVLLWINQSGERWSDPIQINGTPPASETGIVRLADVLGNGISGVLWSAAVADLARESMFFLDFVGGVKPYLLDEMNNNMGAVTRVEYAPSTRFYQEDEKRLRTRWRTTVPFPVQVVSRVEVIDAISGGKLTTEYSYHHGYWDGTEREFRGFGRVDQRDTEIFEDYNMRRLAEDHDFVSIVSKAFSSPTETRTWFHLGPIGDLFGNWEEADFSNEFWRNDPQVLPRPQIMSDYLRGLPRRLRRDALRSLRGLILRTELYALDGNNRETRPYLVTEHLNGVREESPPEDLETARRRIFFPFAVAERTTLWERGDDPMTDLTFIDEYDEYGQARSHISFAVPRGRDFLKSASSGEAQSYLVTHGLTSFAERNDDEGYFVDRVSRTATYEVINDGSQSVFELLQSITGGLANRRLLELNLHFYDGPAFEGRSLGKLDRYGAITRTETLVLTEDILDEAYRTGSALLTPPERPPYLSHDGSQGWTEDYPEEFRESLAPLAGYRYRTSDSSLELETGYYVVSERRRYDFHDDSEGKGRGMVKVSRDPLGYDTEFVHDSFDLLTVSVKDPEDLTTSIINDYRVVQPTVVIGPNGNRTSYAFTPLGFLASTALMGKEGEAIGDTSEAPSTRLQYDFSAFADQGRPVSVRSIRRIYHKHDSSVPVQERDIVIEAVEYSDGFGRLLQTRSQAENVIFGGTPFGDGILLPNQSEPAGDLIGEKRQSGEPPRVVVSGSQTYDNKGRVVEKYEPFFSSGWEYNPPGDEEIGRKSRMYYDPRGQVIRTVDPDGSEQRVIYGVPVDLSDPDDFTPTPWEGYTYDANDNAGRTHPDVSEVYDEHWNTPVSAVVDALGRTVETVERNGTARTDWYVTRSSYDIQGNLLLVTDPMQRVKLRHVYDLARNPVRVEDLDGGVRRIVLDSSGNEIEVRDSKEALILRAFDRAGRLTHMWARCGRERQTGLRQRYIYGDSTGLRMSASEAAEHNLLGRLHILYDEAGLLSFPAYDFEGNVVDKKRRIIKDEWILNAIDSAASVNWEVKPFMVNWRPPDGTTSEAHANAMLDSKSYDQSFMYDALNRLRLVLYPGDVEGERRTLRARYNRAGALKSLEVEDVVYVDHIAYNSKGHRVFIAYGNGVMTKHAYDPATFRIVRLRTEHYSKPDPLTFHAEGQTLQDSFFEYDLAGNLMTIHERSPESGIEDGLDGEDALDRTFSYDPIYRLLSASGRECGVESPRSAEPRCEAVDQTRGYTQEYGYDPVGNIRRLLHRPDDNEPSKVREFTLHTDSNRIASVAVDGDVDPYEYDGNGNLIKEGDARHFEWDHSDRLTVFRIQQGPVEPTLYAHYLYDYGGQRVKKIVRRSAEVEVSVYIDGLFEHHVLSQGNTTQENNSLHVVDEDRRIAVLRIGSAFTQDASPPVQYHLSDHVGSSALVVDGEGALVNREEYTPYGETSFGGFIRKHYRFAGKERDGESGLYYYGARYYAPWLARWISCDPAGNVDGLNLYAFVRDNPYRYSDPAGTQSIEERIESIESPVGWFFARTAYDLWDMVSLGTLSKVEAKENLGTLEGLGESAFVGARSVTNVASMGLQDRIYETQMKEGSGFQSVARGVIQAGADILPIEEAEILANPDASVADRWRAGGMALSKTANLFAAGAGLTGRSITVPREKGLGTHPKSASLKQVQSQWQKQALRGKLRKTKSQRVRQRRIWEREHGKLDSKYQVDHIVDKQLGGALRDIKNLAPLEGNLNLPAGVAKGRGVQSQIRGHRWIKRYDRVLTEGQRVPVPDAAGVPLIHQATQAVDGGG